MQSSLENKICHTTLQLMFSLSFFFFPLSFWYLLRSKSSKFHSNKIYCTFPFMFAFLTSYLKSPSLKFIKQCSYMFSKKLTEKLALKFRFLIHLEFISVYGVRCSSHFLFCRKLTSSVDTTL